MEYIMEPIDYITEGQLGRIPPWPPCPCTYPGHVY